MPDLGPLLLPGAKEYAEECLRRSIKAVAETNCLIDVSYGGDPFQKLDIFLPNSAAPGGVPVLLFLHGGAWKNGFKEWMGFMAPALLDPPAIFVSANYRMAPRVKVPAMLEDCCDALAWLWRNIAAYGGDPARLFVGGHSAGGHLATLMTLRPALLAGRGLPTDVVKGCFPLSAAFDLRRDNADMRMQQMLNLLLDERDNGATVSTFTHVKGNRTPLYIAYGSNDLPELMTQNQRFIEALASEPCTLLRHVLDGCDHFSSNLACGDPAGRWASTVRQWLYG